MLGGFGCGVPLHKKCDRSVCLINEAFTCNVFHRDLTATRILFDMLDTQLLRPALKTQNMACVHIHCRGMINSPLPGVRQFTFILVFFGKLPAFFLRTERSIAQYGWFVDCPQKNAVCVSRGHISGKVSN